MMSGFLNLHPGNGTAGTVSSSYTLVNSPADGAGPDNTFSFAQLEGKDPWEQLELLNKELLLEQRIMEGAENLLNMQLLDSLRSQVETELGMAKTKIDAILKRIEALNSWVKSRAVNGAPSRNRRTSEERPSSLQLPSPKDKEDQDNFRTALHHASGYLKTLQSLRQADVDEANHDIFETISKLTEVLRRNLRVRYELSAADVLQPASPFLADKYSKVCHAAVYRLLRHALVDCESVKAFAGRLDWYIVRSLNRDNKFAIEKEQAIKLIRAMIETGTVRHELPIGDGTCIVPLSEPIMRALIAIAEHAEDPFRLICIQTLAEILLLDIGLVSRTGGTRFLLQLLSDGPPEIMPLLTTTFLHVADSPRTRAYLRVGSDLEVAASSITDAYGKGLEHVDQMRNCAKIVQIMLRTWSGLMYFCMDDMRAIRSLINTLRIPSLDSRDIILDMFFDLLNIKSPEWYQTFIDGRRLTMYRKSKDATDQLPRQETDASIERTYQPLRLTDQYIALLVLVFDQAGICDALTCVIEESTAGSNLSRKATLLMAEILQMANRVLPLSLAAKIQAVPQVFTMATDFDDGEHRIIGTTTMSAIDSFNRNRARLQVTNIKPNRPRANSVEDVVRRGQRQVEQVKLKMSMQMDDKTFQSSLLETQVMLTKDHTKWNFDTLQELIDGPLLNPKRMEEAIKVSRFIRRLMSFFHPFSHRFSDIPRLKSNIKWVRLGCSLMGTLMQSPDGVRYLSNEDQFLAQIVKGFAQLDPFNGLPDSDPIFSKKRVAETLTYGYLEMLGTLSKYKEGIELLEKFKVFTAFYHLSELRSREDLTKGIIENLDYSIDGHPRIVLSKALTSSYKHIRLYATQHLGELIRGSSTANAWTLRLLLTQLYDPAPEVCELAVHFLEEACESKDILQLVVEMQPMMDHLGEIGHPLLLKFMSTPVGFRYLYDAGYIDREMEMWFHERNIYYVIQVEVFLAKTFNSFGDDDEDELAFESMVPPHFYGEMAKTELGCQILQEKGHFSEFSQFIRQHGHESEDTELIMKLKSILWAVGNVGATEGGLPFLEDEDIIPAVLDIAEKSLIPSIRGTCFFVLGLISSTSQGAEILNDYHWEATLSPLGLPTGLCVPLDFQTFITIPPWATTQPEVDKRLAPPASETELEVLTAIQHLGNSVIANAASRSLAKMKSRQEYKPVFSSPVMFFRALHVISTQRYRLPVRRYIMDLFNVELDEEVIDTFKQSASSLQMTYSTELPPTDVGQLHMFGHLGRTRRPSESDDDDVDDLDGATTPPGPVKEQPKISLRPVSKIIGFAV